MAKKSAHNNSNSYAKRAAIMIHGLSLTNKPPSETAIKSIIEEEKKMLKEAYHIDVDKKPDGIAIFQEICGRIAVKDTSVSKKVTKVHDRLRKANKTIGSVTDIILKPISTFLEVGEHTDENSQPFVDYCIGIGNFYNLKNEDEVIVVVDAVYETLCRDSTKLDPCQLVAKELLENTGSVKAPTEDNVMIG